MNTTPFGGSEYDNVELPENIYDINAYKAILPEGLLDLMSYVIRVIELLEKYEKDTSELIRLQKYILARKDDIDQEVLSDLSEHVGQIIEKFSQEAKAELQIQEERVRKLEEQQANLRKLEFLIKNDPEFRAQINAFLQDERENTDNPFSEN